MESTMLKSKLEPLLSTLGQLIKKRRVAQGMSQLKLGDRCGLHRSYISDIERGNRNLTLGAITLVADGLGLQLRELLILAIDKDEAYKPQSG